MVKNIPTIERSTKIRFGKHATDDQAENTIVFNASNVAIDASTAGGVYITPMRTVDPSVPEITVLSYNTVTKEIVNSNTASADLFNANLQFVSQRGNVTSNTLEFINPTTAFVTTGNVGIQNTNPTHALDIGSDFHVTQGGEVRIGPSVLIDSSVTNQIQVAGRIDTDSITLDHIGLSNNNPTITGLSLGSSTFLQHPTGSINAFSTTGNVSAAFYHGDSYFLSNLTLDNIITQGNAAATKTVEFNTPVTAFITSSNVGILNTSPIHTLDVGSNLFIDDKGSNILVVTGNTYTSRKALVGSNVTIDTLGSNVVEVTGNTFTSRKALVGSNLVMDTLGSNVVEVTGNTFTSRKALVGSNLVMDTLGSNVVEVTGNTFTSRKALIGSNLVMDTLGSNVVEVTGNTYTSRKVLVGSNVTIDTLGSNVVEVTGNTFTSRKALVGSNVTIDTLGSNVVEVTGNTFTSRKALVGSNLVMDTLGSNVVEVTGNVNVSNYTKTDYITVQKDAHIKGNLLVEGTTTTIDTTNTTFEDAIISLANNNQISTTDIGIIMKQPNDDASPTITFRGDEKEMMVGYTLNNSLDTEVTPDLANVIDLHVYGNVIVQNNLTLTSGNITTVTVNSNVFGDNVVATNTMYGKISGSNLISASNITVGNLFTNSNIYGNIAGSNLISASNITVGNLFTNSNIYGNIAGSNLISASNITVGNLFTNSNIYGNIAGSNLISASNVTTGILHVESNVITDNVESTTVKISGLTSGFIPIVGSDNILEDSVIEYSGDTTTISSNVEITGNLSVLGNTFTIESNSLVINDRVLGIANNNVSHSLDVGIIMGHPEHNVAFIHHGEPDGQDNYGHELVLGYTDNVVTDNHVLYTDANLITFRVLGDIITQNNLTLTSGDLTAITVNSNVVGDNVSVITLNGNVVGDNVSVTTVYGNVIGDGVITTNMFGTIAGANTINASTISALTINSNIVADNVSAITLNSNVVGDNVSVITLNGNVVADNVVATNGIYGAIAGQNTVTASTIYVGTGSPALGDWELRVDGDTEIMGNLRVAGTTTTVDTQNLVVKDPIIQLGDASSSVDSGLLLARPSSTDNVYVGYDQNRTEFAIGFTDNHAGDSDITIKQGEDFTLNVYGNVEANYLFGNGSQLTGIQTATPNLHDVVNVDNVTSNVVQFSNATAGIKIASNIAFDDKITLQSLTPGSKNGFFVVDTIQLDPSYASPTRNVLSYDTTTGQIYDSGGQGGSSFDNITEQDANVFIGSNLIINTYGSNVLTVGGNISANNITLGALTIAASPFGLDDIVSSASGSNVTSNVLQIEGIESNVITANNITVSGNTTSQNIKLTNTDITASVTSGTITVDAKEKTYGTAPLVVSTTDVSNLVFSNLITGAQIVIPILADGGAINISSTMTNVNFYAMTSDVSVAQDKHALMTLSNLYGNIYMNAIGFS